MQIDYGACTISGLKWNRNTFSVAACVHITYDNNTPITCTIGVDGDTALYETVFRLIRSSTFTTRSMARAVWIVSEGCRETSRGASVYGLSLRAAMAAAEMVVFHQYYN